MRLFADEIAALSGMSVAEAARILAGGEFGVPEYVNGQLAVRRAAVERRLHTRFSDAAYYEAIRGRGMPA